LRAALRSAVNITSIAALNGSNRGAARTSAFRAGGGSAESIACLTVRRCTPSLRD
jgi:hypothetical protein